MMLALLLLIPIAVLLILDYFIADEFRCIAKQKGYCGRKYFWWCFFTGLIGYLMVAALPCCRKPCEPRQDPIPRYTPCHC